MNIDDDFALALKLQEEFENEPNQNHVRKSGKNVMSPPNKTLEFMNKENGLKSKSGKGMSIVDQSWEYIDPTPNIHTLFVVFDTRYFWGKLKNVEVRWSPRMTSCAGVCSYEGRGGLCSVRLSLPLLKLRPRKDLVETLLHEMIHAYLFVTHNNRDRDGHGPEFHKHMNRINNEAGTRITVYHSFHDEVKLYKQHWWRCNGPCQKRPPYFGMVKRAMNRAPGPTDFWWKQHQETCGGVYNKVREPEGFSKKKPKNTEKKVISTPTKKNDIRTFFPFHGKGNALGSSSTGNGVSSNKTPYPPKLKTNPSNITAFKDLKNKQSTGSNSKKPAASATEGNKRPGGFGGMLANKGGGTLVITAKGSKSKPVESENKSTVTTDVGKKGVNRVNNVHTMNDINNDGANHEGTPVSFVPFAGKGHTLGGSGVSRLLKIKSETVTSKVKQFDGMSNDVSKSSSNTAKGASVSPQKSQNSNNMRIGGSGMDATVISKVKQSNGISSNVSKSYSSNRTKGASVSPQKSPSSNNMRIKGSRMDEFKVGLSNKSTISPEKSNGITDNSTLDSKKSSTPSKQSHSSDVSTSPNDGRAPKRHSTTADNINDIKKVKNNSSIDLTSEADSRDMVNCPICNCKVREVEINTHLDSCIGSDVAVDNHVAVENSAVKFAPDSGIIKCPACNSDTLKRNLESHLEECLQSVFGNRNVQDEDDDDDEDKWGSESSTSKPDDNLYPCPCCMTLVKEIDMNAHLDVCLCSA